MDNKILFSHIGDTPSFEIIPQNDTVFIYDNGGWVKETSNGSLIIEKVKWCPKDSVVAVVDNKREYIHYHYEDSTALLSTAKRLVFLSEWQVTPYLWNGSYAEEIERIY